MSNATLMYVINNGKDTRNLRLITESLFNLDKYTCNFKNEDDFINNFQKKNDIEKFILENGKKGHILINYAKSVTEKEQILPLFNSKDIFIFKDDPYEGKITEVEKARRLLFNSKNQLFIKLVLSFKIIDKVLSNLIEINDKEYDQLVKYNFHPSYINYRYYIDYKSLFEYRLHVNKLGCIRNCYEEMLDDLKTRMMELDGNSYYYYNRQLRIAINVYNEMINKELFIKNLKIKNLKNNKYILCRNKI